MSELRGEVFTPRVSKEAAINDRYWWPKESVTFHEGYEDVRGTGYKGRITVDGKQFDVFGMDCDLEGCACDAYVKEVQ